ncbi:MAG: helix-turn-helix transcriptional regulator [bacterium]|nr:helix-turn-helix transcriptional regulator [bacterium]
MTFDQRLHRDARLLAGDPEAAALFECLVKHLFDPALDKTYLARVCGAKRAARERLAAKLGMKINVYVTELRMIEAKRRVLETKETIAEIGKRVGIPVERTFRRLFGKAHGMASKDMRAESRAPKPTDTTDGDDGDEARTEVEPRTEDDDRPKKRALAARLRRRATAGLLDREGATELRFSLRRRHPALDEAEARAREVPPGQEYPQYPVLLTPTGDHLERIAAASAYGEIMDMPEDEARFTLTEGLRLGNVTAFRHLYQVCALLVQHDRDRALLMAELGVQLIEQHRELMGEEGDDWKAMAWARLARIQSIAGEDGGAEKSLGFAWEEVLGGELPAWVEIEVRRVEGTLRNRQRRWDEATRALDRAVELADDPELRPKRAEVLLERLELATGLGDAEAGLELCDRLQEWIDTHESVATLWHGFVAYHRGKAFAAAGRECCAGGWLKRTVEVIRDDPAADSNPRLGMLFTFALHELARLAANDERLDDSETLLRAAAERYRALGASVFETTAVAELAVVCALLGRRAEAHELAAAAAAFLDDLPFHREAWNAGRRLLALANGGPEASESQLIELLIALREDLDLARWEITGTQAEPAARTRRKS